MKREGRIREKRRKNSWEERKKFVEREGRICGKRGKNSWEEREEFVMEKTKR